MEISAKEIAIKVNGRVEGDPNMRVSSFARIENGKKGEIVFYGNPKYESYLYQSRASIIIVSESFEPSETLEATLIRVDEVYSAVATLLNYFASLKKSRRRGRSLRASVSLRAKIGRGCYIAPGVVIERGAKIGRGVQIYPQVYIGRDCQIGDNAILYSGVKLYHETKVGANTIIHSNAVIGADGFGFAPQEDGSYLKIEQGGDVIIGENCEIGANTTIDRASIGSTIIESGVKLDNLVQIAHNVEVGANTVMAAQTGISGSVKIGAGSQFGGQVGVAGHLSIAPKSSIGAQSGILSSLKEEGKSYLGSPAMEAREYLKAYSIFRRLHKK